MKKLKLINYVNLLFLQCNALFNVLFIRKISIKLKKNQHNNFIKIMNKFINKFINFINVINRVIENFLNK